MAENRFPAAVDALMQGLDGFFTSKTVVGEPVQVGDTIIVPLVDVSFGVGAGSNQRDKKDASMGGMGGKMTPNAVLVIKDGHTKLINVKKQDSMTKLLDMIPDLVDRFTQPNMEEDVTKDEAVDMAFPEEE
ncbi:MAG: GerW family sporulation protein [Lachnospiraceae bacterium]|jgi:uncharacterized spore protein YtfJ|nr:sporulation protein [Lachnospiraceae bacterium]MBQ3793401.1 GerW family sporulation protein [Lachnospiraceae bacterium]MBR1848675.1 GerW family sporulation protein [Lachnospiraceae bacterium]MCR5319702.1 GerW family sporulation protein [Lachnospiraceae bacterium]